MARQVLILCERCQSEGRLLTSNGGPDDTDHGECPDCKGQGVRLVDSVRATLEESEAIRAGRAE